MSKNLTVVAPVKNESGSLGFSFRINGIGLLDFLKHSKISARLKWNFILTPIYLRTLTGWCQ